MGKTNKAKFKKKILIASAVALFLIVCSFSQEIQLDSNSKSEYLNYLENDFDNTLISKKDLDILEDPISLNIRTVTDEINKHIKSDNAINADVENNYDDLNRNKEKSTDNITNDSKIVFPRIGCYFVDATTYFVADFNPISRKTDIDLFLNTEIIEGGQIAYNLCGDTLVTNWKGSQAALIDKDFNFNKNIAGSYENYNEVVYLNKKNAEKTNDYNQIDESNSSTDSFEIIMPVGETCGEVKKEGEGDNKLYTLKWTIKCNNVLPKEQLNIISNNFNDKNSCDFNIVAESKHGKHI